MSRKPVVGVVGSGREEQPATDHARALGELLARHGYVVICGGRDAGVMRAVTDGAKAVAGSLTIGILPDASTWVAPGVDVAVVTDLGHARNNVIVLSSEVVVACGVDGPGTASEVALALKNGKPVVLLGAAAAAVAFFRSLDPVLVHTAATPDEAVRLVGELRQRRP